MVYSVCVRYVSLPFHPHICSIYLSILHKPRPHAVYLRHFRIFTARFQNYGNQISYFSLMFSLTKIRIIIFGSKDWGESRIEKKLMKLITSVDNIIIIIVIVVVVVVEYFKTLCTQSRSPVISHSLLWTCCIWNSYSLHVKKWNLCFVVNIFFMLYPLISRYKKQ